MPEIVIIPIFYVETDEEARELPAAEQYILYTLPPSFYAQPEPRLQDHRCGYKQGHFCPDCCIWWSCPLMVDMTCKAAVIVPCTEMCFAVGCEL